MRKITEIVLHHPAVKQDFIDANRGPKLRNVIRQWHLEKGWSDIGYHYVLNQDESGTPKVYNGRNDRIAGAHVLNHNSYTLGVMVGYGMGTVPNPKMIDALVELLYTLCKTYGIKPSNQTIKGHRDYPGHRSNNCPGDNLYAMIPSVIQRVQAKFVAKSLPVPVPPKANAPLPKGTNEWSEQTLTDIDVVLPNGAKLNGVLIGNDGFVAIKDLKVLGVYHHYQGGAKPRITLSNKKEQPNGNDN